MNARERRRRDSREGSHGLVLPGAARGVEHMRIQLQMSLTFVARNNDKNDECKWGQQSRIHVHFDHNLAESWRPPGVINVCCSRVWDFVMFLIKRLHDSGRVENDV